MSQICPAVVTMTHKFVLLLLLQIVFFTTLFYLLASSSNHYKPVEWISQLTIARSGSKFAQAVEDGIGYVD